MSCASLPSGWVKMSEKCPNDGKYLVSVLNPFFGTFTITIDYAFLVCGVWRSWSNNEIILVIAWKEIDEEFNSDMFPELNDLFGINGQKVWQYRYNSMQFGTDKELETIWKYF